MKNKELLQIYNNSLDENFKHFRLNSFDDLNSISIEKLKILIDFFVDKISAQEISSSGEISKKGAMLDEIVGVINDVILSKS